jgi:hypothetical protein
MPKYRNITLVGVRSDGGQTLGSAINAVVTIDSSEGLYLIPKGGNALIRFTSQGAAEEVTWPEDLPFTTEAFMEAAASTERIPGLTITVGSGVSLVGWVVGGVVTVTPAQPLSSSSPSSSSSSSLELPS